MGQRSQIYIRIKDEDGNTTLFAKYFQWNFGERMISRARYGIEYIKRNMEYINQDTVQQRINKIFDINFDMQDVALSTDILQEVRNDFWWDRSSVNDYIFSGQDNNDGKLFIDCDQTSNEIKFCFTDYDLKILTPNKYMKWDIGEEWKSNKFYDEPDLNKEWQEIIPICESNIEYINRNAKMMNELEDKECASDLDSFLDFYEWSITKYPDGKYNIKDEQCNTFDFEENTTLEGIIDRVYYKMFDYFIDEEDIEGLIKDGDFDYVKSKYESYMRTGEKLKLIDELNRQHYENWFQEITQEKDSIEIDNDI